MESAVVSQHASTCYSAGPDVVLAYHSSNLKICWISGTFFSSSLLVSSQTRCWASRPLCLFMKGGYLLIAVSIPKSLIRERRTYESIPKSIIIFPCPLFPAETPLTSAVAQICGSLAPKSVITFAIKFARLGAVSPVQAVPGSALLIVTSDKVSEWETRAANSRAK